GLAPRSENGGGPHGNARGLAAPRRRVAGRGPSHGGPQQARGGGPAEPQGGPPREAWPFGRRGDHGRGPPAYGGGGRAAGGPCPGAIVADPPGTSKRRASGQTLRRCGGPPGAGSRKRSIPHGDRTPSP